MRTYKGFDKDLKCNNHQYEIGGEFKLEGEPKCCSRGFHSCENPLDVLNYYPPTTSRYCEVEADGVIDKQEKGDSKIASSKIKIGLEIGLKGLICASVKFLMEKISATSGDFSHSATSGNYSHSATAGDSSHSATSGNNCVAASFGRNSKCKAALGSWIVCTEWVCDGEKGWEILTVKTAKIDGKKLKPDTWYKLKDKKFVESPE